MTARCVTLIQSDMLLSSFRRWLHTTVFLLQFSNAGTCYSIAVAAPPSAPPAAAPVEDEILVDDEAHEEAAEPIVSNGNGASVPVASVPEPEAPEPEPTTASNGAAFTLPDGVEAAEEDTQGWTLFKFRS